MFNRNSQYRYHLVNFSPKTINIILLGEKSKINAAISSLSNTDGEISINSNSTTVVKGGCRPEPAKFPDKYFLKNIFLNQFS